MVIKRENLMFFIIILVFALLFNIDISVGANPCLDLTCESGKTCKVSENGIASCIGYQKFNEGGRSVLYTYGSCLAEKPKYLDLNGKVKGNYCYGTDGKIGTEDDCGCPSKYFCQNDGSCAAACSDGTIEGKCSNNKPLFCYNGTLIHNSEKCDCPIGKKASASGKCLTEKEYVSYSANEFTDGKFSLMRMSYYDFNNFASYKNVVVSQGSCSYPQVLTDNYATLYKTSRYAFNEMYCKVPNNGESYIIELGSAETFNRIEINFGNPYIFDYSLEYYDDVGESWKLLANEHNDFTINEYDYLIDNLETPPDFIAPDEGYIKYYYDMSTVNINDRMARQQASYDGIKYEIIHKTVTFPQVTSSKIRFTPLNWQQDAKIYELSIYNNDNELVLSKLPSVNQGAIKYNEVGTFESKPIYLNVSPSEMKYTSLKWDVGADGINNDIKKITNLNSNATFFYYDSKVYPEFDEGYKYYGFNGSVPFDFITSGSYPAAGYPSIYYGKYCLNDGKSIGQTSPVAQNHFCVMHPAIMDNVTDFSNDIIDSTGFENGNALGGANTTNKGISGNRSALFDGINDSLNLGNPSSNELNSFSLSFWVNKDTDSNTQFKPLITKGNMGSKKMLFSLSINGSNNLKFEISNSSDIYSSVSDSSPSSTWVNFVVTYDDINKNIKIYRNSTLITSKDLPIGFNLNRKNNDSIRVASDDLRTSFFKGMIDELIIFPKVISQDTIYFLYDKQLNNQTLDKSGMIHYFKFDEKSWSESSEDGSASITVSPYFSDESVTINRLKLDELVNRVEFIQIYGFEGTDFQTGFSHYLDPKNTYNTQTTIEIPPVTGNQFYVIFYNKKNKTLDESSPLIWELELLNVEKNTMSFTIPKFYIGFQIRTGSTKQDLASSDWYGPNGVKDTYFVNSGDEIGENHNGNVWVQYRVVVNTTNKDYTPMIDNISIGYVGGESLKPIASIDSIHAAKLDQEIVFSGINSFNPDGKILVYRWDFGDGENALGSVVSHRFNSTGQKRVVLTVVDSENQIARAETKVDVTLYDCLALEDKGGIDSVLFPMSDPTVSQTASRALREYADRKKIDIKDIDTLDEKLEASLEFIQNHMSYRADDENKLAVQEAGGAYIPPTNQIGNEDYPMSLPITVKYTGSKGCTLNSEFCGDCEDFSIMFTTIARALGINSKCVYSASGVIDVGHVYNIINYQGKWRVLEPQQGSLTESLYSNSLSWNKSNMPYYFVDSVFNDKNGSYLDIYTKNSVENAYSTMKLIQNYIGSDGYPDSSNKCNSAFWNKYSSQRYQFNQGDANGWDPASLFKDICP